MRRIPLALALVGAVAVTGCMGGGKSSSSTDADAQKGVVGVNYIIKVPSPAGGYISSSPAGITCGQGIDVVCSGTFAWTQTVVLTAHPTAPNQLIAWAGDCAGSALDCTINAAGDAGADKTVVAVFGAAGSGHQMPFPSSMHKPAYEAFVAGTSALKCNTCHGVDYGGLANAPSCATCHAAPGFEPRVAPKNLVVNALAFGDTTVVTATFSVTDGTTPVTGLTTSDTTIYLAGLIPGTAGGSDEWQYWSGVSDASLDETSPGTYLLRTNKASSDAPAGSTTQRGYVRVQKTGLLTVVNGYDFNLNAKATPVAAGKDVVNDASCKDCHGYGVTIHSYGRNDTKVCVICHSPNYNSTIATNEADMVTMVHQIHTNKALTLGGLHVSGHGENWPTLKYPGTILNCAKCHNTVANADNWKNKPTQVACDSCHTTIKFDGTAYTGIKGGVGSTHNLPDNSMCTGCHSAAYITTKHTPTTGTTSIVSKMASLRPVTSTVDSVSVDGNGGITVAFSVWEDSTINPGTTTPKTNVTAASFTLAKLVPATGDAPSYWQSYLSKVRTKDANKPPVVQGRNESVTDGGILTNIGDGTYTYKFKLLNAATFSLDGTGDIRTITHAHNNSTVAGQYNSASLPTMLFPVTYEPTLTHRVAVSISGNKIESFLDFVPAGNPAETRNIVSRAACNNCHGEAQLHAGIAVEYCVGCHNQNSFDPFSGKGTPTLTTTDPAEFGDSSVELERLVHKVHMGRGLSLGYTVNGTHYYSNLQYPGGTVFSSSTPNASDCRMCHDESNVAMTEAANWKTAGRACLSCHDSAAVEGHRNANVAIGCATCHAPAGMAPVSDVHLGAAAP